VKAQAALPDRKNAQRLRKSTPEEIRDTRSKHVGRMRNMRRKTANALAIESGPVERNRFIE